MRIVFMGTPEFAVPSLEALLKSDDPVVGIVTQPDRPKGRGQRLTSSPVKIIAQREQLPLLQPTKMKDAAFMAELSSWRPDVIAVAAFGRILPPAILSLPPRGCINVHGSLLPKYRGAGPIQWAIINGEIETGITTMLMDEGMDTGGILLQEKIAIGPEDTAGSLSSRLADLGGRLLVETLAQLKAGTLTPRPQNHNLASLAPLLKKEDGVIDWSLSATMIANRIRGLTPWPGAYTFLQADRWMIYRAAAMDEAATLAPGHITAVTKDAIHVATGKGVLAIRELQPANGRRMPAAQYLAGHPLQIGMQLSPSTRL
jgi:methionyl-tRNA formyltransferase